MKFLNLWYYTKSQKGSEIEGLIIAIPFIRDPISNILFASGIHLQLLIITPKKC